MSNKITGGAPVRPSPRTYQMLRVPLAALHLVRVLP